MAEHCSFFNSTPEDIREYTESEFAKYFSRFLSNGIYTENELMGLRVETVIGLNIKINTGFAYVQGYLYENDADILFTLDAADNILDRIDRIVLKLDKVNRVMNIKLKKGIMGSSPVAPVLINNTTIVELPIAQIRINKNVISGTIIDERIPVHSLIEIPYGDMVHEFDEWFEAKQGSVGIEIYNTNIEPLTMAPGDVWLREW